MSSSFLLASRYGYPISSCFSSQHSDRTATSHAKRKLLSLSRLAATIASASPSEGCLTFGLRTNQFLVVPMSVGRPFLILLSFNELNFQNIRMKAFMIDVVLTALFASDLDKLGEDIETRANHDLQNSTCSDTVGDEEFSLSGDQFEVFEDHFIRPLLEMATVNDLWTAPVINAYSQPSSAHSSGLLLTLFQLSPTPLSSLPPPTHSFIPLVGEQSVVSLLPDIPLALHAIALPSLSTPMLFPSLSLEGEEKAVLIAPTHIENAYWILIAPWSLLTSLPLPALSSPPAPLPASQTRLVQGLLASLQRFALFLPLSLPNFDPHDVGMVTELLSPKAPNQHDEGGLSPIPPPSQQPNPRPAVRSRRG